MKDDKNGMNPEIDCRNVTVSAAGPEDLEEILELQKTAFMSEARRINDYSIPPLRQTLHEICDEFGHSAFLKAAAGTRIVGSVRAELRGETCVIKKLIVHPDCQNRGIGSLLLSEIEQMFPGTRKFELFTGKESKRNHEFYTCRGYTPFKEERITENLVLVYFEKCRRPWP